MKIGVITFWWSEDNYGQILQCYALQKYLRDTGHDAYLIRYDPRKDYIKTPVWEKIVKAFNPVMLYRFLSSRICKILVLMERRKNPRHFNVFRNKYIKQSEKIYYSYDELKNDPPEADIYIVGSDQVWNTFGVSIKKARNIIRAFLLDFGAPHIKRIAYAASFGNENIDEYSTEIFGPLLKKLNYVSVREQSGVDICEKCGIHNAECVPDPTMLLNIDIYRKLYTDKTVEKPSKPYCFIYFLCVPTYFSIETGIKWAKEKNLEVIYVSGNSRYDTHKKLYANISDWIFLIDNAEYVITNSYHASVFSLIFQKKFGVASIKGHLAGINSRFKSLFEQFEIEGRFIDYDISVLEKKINWLKISSIFNKKKCKLKNFIDINN